MPALDQCHPQVVRALEKEGWTVLPVPHALLTPINYLFIDIEAHRLIDGDEQIIIIVEVKCFYDEKRVMEDLYNAIGQYLVYRNLLKREANEAELYLAVPTVAYYGIFQVLALPLINDLAVKIMLVDLEKEEIEQWIS